MPNEMLCLHVMQQPQVPNPPLRWRVLTALLAPADAAPCGGREPRAKLPFGIAGYRAKACAAVCGRNSGHVLEIRCKLSYACVRL